MYRYILRSFDGRSSLPQEFTSLVAAKKAAKRIFRWNRLYSSNWFPCCDKDDDEYSAIQLAEKPSDINEYSCYAPVIERRTNKRKARNKTYDGLFS